MPAHVESKECIIAYLDILGGTNYIKNDTPNEENLNTIRMFYDEINQFLGNESGTDAALELFQSVKRKSFSDNIVFVQEISDPISEIDAIFRVFGNVINYQFFGYVNHGWLMRGGMVKGKCYIDEDMVWGKGLLSAIDLESKLAVFPRVIVDSDIMAIFQKSTAGYKNSIRFRRDFDGLYFIDYLNGIFNDEVDPNYIRKFENKFPVIKANIMSYLAGIPRDASLNSKSIRIKHLWQIRYFNQIMKEINMEKYCVDEIDLNL